MNQIDMLRVQALAEKADAAWAVGSEKEAMAAMEKAQND